MFNVLIIGGDARYLEVIDALLRKKDTTIFLIGYENITFDEQNVVTLPHGEVDFSTFQAIILPVHGTTENGLVTSTYSDEHFFLTKEMIEQTPKDCVIYTGTTNHYLNEIAKNRTLEVIFARDDVAIYNAIPTAEATLQLAIEHTDRTVHGSDVAVLGFGRVGFTVARLFHLVGANVTVYVRKPSDIARITEMGMNPHLINELGNHIEHCDIVINTIPHLVIDENIINAMNANTLIIDLASHPGGVDFEFAKEKAIKTLHALGLPGKTAPKTAGEIIANTIISLMDAMK